MEKKEQLYEGKAKKLFATDDPTVLWVHYMNQATAGNGEKKALIEGKGRLNNLITSRIFELLASQGIHSHFIQQISQTDQLVQKMSMFPLEIIVRNIAAGSFARRYGIEEGALLKKPVLEFCLKSDDLADPFISQDAIVALDLASEEELKEICEQAYTINSALTQIFSAIDITLVDFKIEEGKNTQGEILLADEITPDTCRLWDRRNISSENTKTAKSTENTAIHHLDKDLFRRDLGDIIPAYEEIYTRLTDISLALPA